MAAGRVRPAPCAAGALAPAAAGAVIQLFIPSLLKTLPATGACDGQHQSQIKTNYRKRCCAHSSETSLALRSRPPQPPLWEETCYLVESNAHPALNHAKLDHHSNKRAWRSHSSPEKSTLQYQHSNNVFLNPE